MAKIGPYHISKSSSRMCDNFPTPSVQSDNQQIRKAFIKIQDKETPAPNYRLERNQDK